MICNYGHCVEEVGSTGLTVSLKAPEGGFTRASYCCASHAVVALIRLALDRRERELAEAVDAALDAFMEEYGP